MKKCTSCKTEIDPKVKKCPHCQAVQQLFPAKRIFFTALGILVVIAILLGLSDGNKSPSTATSQASSATSQVTPTPTPEATAHTTLGERQMIADHIKQVDDRFTFQLGEKISSGAQVGQDNYVGDAGNETVQIIGAEDNVREITVLAQTTAYQQVNTQVIQDIGYIAQLTDPTSVDWVKQQMITGTDNIDKNKSYTATTVVNGLTYQIFLIPNKDGSETFGLDVTVNN